MRDVSDAFLDKLTTSRAIGGRLTFRDTRLVFSMRSLNDSLGLSDPSTADVCRRGNGFFRVVNHGGALYYQDVPDPTLVTWPNWTDGSVALQANSRPGVEDIGSSTSRLWYQKSNGDVAYRDYSGSLGAETVVTSSYSTKTLTLAPVNATTCYIHWLDGNWGAVARLHTSLAPANWEGRVYGDCQTARYFDAVQLDNWDYLYVADNNHGRVLVCKASNEVWSDLTYVVPLDVIDTTSFFRLAYASIINEKIFLTGRISRPSDYDAVAFDIYTIGPDHYTMGRDLYIDSVDTGGKLFLVGDTVWYVGVSKVGEADATMLVGVDLASKKFTTSKCNSFRLACAANRSATLSLDMDPSVDSALIRRGAEITLEASMGGEYCTLARLGIDGLSPSWEQDGRDSGIVARSLSLKKLSRWESDQSYDYWSQAKQSSNPSELDEVVRSSGQWELSGEPLILKQLNVEGVLYMVAKASRGGLMRAKFYKPTGDFDPLYGVILNYYHETRAEAAVRLDKEIKDVTDDEIGHNGIVALWGGDQHEGGAGIALYFWRNNVLTKLTSGAQAIPDDTWHWIQIAFNDGLIKAYYRIDAGTDWTEVVSHIFNDQTYAPWRRETFGRGAMYLNNRTPHSTTPGFTSTSKIIPVADVTQFPTSETIIVDSEQIEYDGKTTGALEGDLTWTEGLTHSMAIHDNEYFDGLTLWSKTGGSSGGDFDVGKAVGQTMVGMSWGPKVAHRLNKARYKVKKVGSPGPLYCYYVVDAYDNYGGKLPAWARIKTTSIPASEIGTEYSWLEFTLDTDWLPPGGHWAFLTMTPPDASPVYDVNNYYKLYIDNTKFKILRSWGGGWTSYSDKHAEYEFVGADKSGVGGIPGEIYLDGAGVSTPRDKYNDLALAVIDGPGKNTIFRVIDYDYQAPRQWEPNQEYEAPDKWQDHIGDPAHGEWVIPDMSRIFVSPDPSSVVGPGSILKMYPALKVKEVDGVYKRGVNDTSVTSHGSATASVYRDLSVKCDRVEFYSLEQDLRIEDIIKELGSKAGVMSYDFDQALSGLQTFQGAGWTTPQWLNERQNFIAAFEYPELDTDTKIGVVFRSSSQPSDIVTIIQGYRIMLTHDYKLRFSIAGESLIEDPVFDGSGLDDISNSGAFTGPDDLDYVVEIDHGSGIGTVDGTPSAGGASYTANDILAVSEGVGGQVKVLTVDGGGAVLTLQVTPMAEGDGYTTGAGKATTGGTGTGCTVNVTALATDSFKWSDDGGATWDATFVNITGGNQLLNYGVYISFVATAGHTLADKWTFTAHACWSLLEMFPIGFVPEGTVTISAQKDAFSVWIGERFVHTFRDGTWTGGENAGLVSYKDVMVTAHWSNLDRLVDNFIFDMGRRGAQLLNELIGPKRIYYHDGQNGELKVFRARDNIGSLVNLNYRGSVGEMDTEQVSRVRVEGYEVAEAVDYDLLKSEGNLFTLLNAVEANDAWESYKEGVQTLKEQAASASMISSSFAADPRVETNDLCTITLPDGDHNILVTNVTFVLDVSGNQPILDMELGAINADQL